MTTLSFTLALGLNVTARRFQLADHNASQFFTELDNQYVSESILIDPAATALILIDVWDDSASAGVQHPRHHWQHATVAVRHRLPRPEHKRHMRRVPSKGLLPHPLVRRCLTRPHPSADLDGRVLPSVNPAVRRVRHILIAKVHFESLS